MRSKKHSLRILMGMIAFLSILLLGVLIFELSRRGGSGRVLCSVAPPPLADSGELNSLLQALDQSIAAFDGQVPKDLARQRLFTPGEVRETLVDFRAKLMELGFGEEFFSSVASNHRFMRNCNGDSLVTGYFELNIEGDVQRQGPFQYPLYRPPPDLERAPAGTPAGRGALTRFRRTPEGNLTPYFTSEEIDYENKLGGTGLEIMWLKSRLDRTYLHIQGSALISLPDGSKARAGFADRNGHPYRAIGHYLLERNIVKPKDLSMQFIRKYVEEHPAEERTILSYNPSYVFFTILPGIEHNPRGSLNVPLTAYRSIAIDPSVLPIGALGYLDGTLPAFDSEGKVIGEKPFRGFVLNQDSGIAIRTAGRVDLFCGRGPDAELSAGSLRHRGNLYVLSRRR